MNNEETKKGRPLKVTPNEILEAIKSADAITTGELADIFDVCKATIRSRLQELRNDDERIFFDNNGHYLLETIKDTSDYEKMKKYLSWIIGLYVGVAKCGIPSKGLVLESKTMLKKLLSKDERLLLAKQNMKVNKIIDYISLEDEMED